jgi:predicted nucleotidyltransferase
MLKLCRVDIERSQEISEAIVRYVNKVARELKPKKIILFGSFATGDFNEASDVDLIVIADWKQNFLDRIKVLLDMNEFRLPLEPIGYTETEFEQMAKEGNRFIAEVTTTGKTLYAENG